MAEPSRRPRGRPDAGNQRSRKRFARRQWRRRWLAWRAVLAAVLVLAIVGVGVYAVWFSAWLDVERVDVSGALTVDPQEIRDRGDIEEGTPLARVDLARAESLIGSLAIVKDVDVSRQWPDTIRIEILERTAIAVVEIGGKLKGMDAEGKIFRDYSRAPAGLPRIQTKVGTGSDALAEAAQVIAALPAELTRIVDYLLVETMDEISLFLKDGRQVVWGSADDSETKAEVLAGLLQTKASVYDVSVPTQPTTK